MRYRIVHRTTYHYRDTVAFCHNHVHLTPREQAGQHVLHSEISVEPARVDAHRFRDFFGNTVDYFTIQQPHRQLSVTAQHVVEVVAPMPVDSKASPAWESVAAALRTDCRPQTLAAMQFALESPLIKPASQWREYAIPSFKQEAPLRHAVENLTRRIHEDFTFDPHATTVATPLEQMFRQRRGVCQDFAHLQIACLRSLGLAGRYVSGYLHTEPAEGRPRLIGADASHAWVQVYCPDTGWFDVDPTNNQASSERHVTLAYGRDFDDVSPIKGVVLGGGEHGLTVSVDMIQNADDRFA